MPGFAFFLFLFCLRKVDMGNAPPFLSEGCHLPHGMFVCGIFRMQTGIHQDPAMLSAIPLLVHLLQVNYQGVLLERHALPHRCHPNRQIALDSCFF